MKVKYLVGCALILFSQVSSAAWETDLRVVEVGAWTTGDTTFYIKFDRTIGPVECRSSLTKVKLGGTNDPEVFLKEKNAIRSMAFAAFAGSYKVKIDVSDTCLYNNPTFKLFYLVK